MRLTETTDTFDLTFLSTILRDEPGTLLWISMAGRLIECLLIRRVHMGSEIWDDASWVRVGD
jgi:hypothetical protein